ncbi:MAG: DNA cytosine methyltransferase [Desulfuromonadaceae bacterium]
MKLGDYVELTLGSLFDGIAGFPLSASGHGIKTLWASEIEPFPIKVSTTHFPDMKHLGSIIDINGANIEPVDIVTFGSPCQDLSVAGKRSGLDGERSHLFFEAVRIIGEMQTATGGQHPRFAIWENVDGAFSSNGGWDFAAVLEALVGGNVYVPEGGWTDAGVSFGPKGQAAWRLFDAQFWGVPQRRARIYLVTDFRGECAGQILFESKGLCRDTQESRKAREEVAACAGDGVAAADRVVAFDGYNQTLNKTMQTIRANKSDGDHVGMILQPIAFNGRQDPVSGPVTGALDTDGLTQCVAQCVTTGTGRRYDSETETLIPVMVDVVGSFQQSSMKGKGTIGYTENPTIAKPVKTQTDGQFIVQPVAFQPGNLSRRAGAEPPEKVFPTLGATTQGDQFPPVAIGFNGDQSEKTRSIATVYDPKDLGRRPATFENVSPTLKARAGTGGNNVPVTLIERNESSDGNTNQAYAGEVLRNLRDKIGAEAFTEWGLGIITSLQQKEVLQSEVYGERVQEQAKKRKPSVDDSALPCEEFSSAGAMLSVWERECQRCSPQRREMEEQRTGEPGKDLPELPQLKTQAEKVLLSMWETGQGTRILRETLAEIQKIRRSDDVKSQPISTRYAVRRLTPLEAERLQGLPDNWTNIPGASDTARYKAIGNGLAIPCPEWIFRRIVEVMKCQEQPIER